MLLLFYEDKVTEWYFWQWSDRPEKLLNSIIQPIIHQKIIWAVYKQTIRVVKLSILIASFAKLV